LRPIAGPFVVAAPAGARVRARLRVSPQDEAVFGAVGSHLGSLAMAAADDLVWGMIEVLTSMRMRLYGRRGVRSRAVRAVTTVKKPAGEPAA
jgi:predicted site-specific integrase-resolvase